MGRGKGSWWRLFIDAENDVISVFTSLGLDDLRRMLAVNFSKKNFFINFEVLAERPSSIIIL